MVVGAQVKALQTRYQVSVFVTVRVDGHVFAGLRDGEELQVTGRRQNTGRALGTGARVSSSHPK